MSEPIDEERRQGPIERRMHPWYRDRVMLGLIASIICSIILFVLYETQSSALSDQATTLGHQAQELDTFAAQLTVAQQRLGSEYVAQVESCKRLNILRVEDNISHLADFTVFTVVLDSSKRIKPPPGTPPEQLKFQAVFLDQLATAVREKSWIPRTDCAKAVNQRGARFRAPKPVEFVHQLPPYSALHFEPGDFQ